MPRYSRGALVMLLEPRPRRAHAAHRPRTYEEIAPLGGTPPRALSGLSRNPLGGAWGRVSGRHTRNQAAGPQQTTMAISQEQDTAHARGSQDPNEYERDSGTPPRGAPYLQGGNIMGYTWQTLADRPISRTARFTQMQISKVTGKPAARRQRRARRATRAL